MTGNDPFARLPEVPDFTVTSETIADGESWSPPQYSGAFGVPGGEDVSPQLTWSGFPAETKSFAVTVFDPDAPTGSGFWHWAIAGLPASITSLPEGAGDGSPLPGGAITLRGDAGAARFIGAAPPAGHGEHRYFITVHALDTDDLGVAADDSPGKLGFLMSSHILGRATIVARGEIPAD